MLKAEIYERHQAPISPAALRVGISTFSLFPMKFYFSAVAGAFALNVHAAQLTVFAAASLTVSLRSIAHDEGEARALRDEVLVLERDRIVQRSSSNAAPRRKPKLENTSRARQAAAHPPSSAHSVQPNLCSNRFAPP